MGDSTPQCWGTRPGHGLALVLVGALLLLAACAAGSTPGAGQPIAIAVWDLEDLSALPAGLPGMGEMLAVQIAARLGGSDHYQVVERQQLVKVMEELHLGSSDLADPHTRLKLGRIIGAHQMVFGAFQTVGSLVRLDLRRVDVASGRILQTATTSAPAADMGGWLRAADQAAEELLR